MYICITHADSPLGKRVLSLLEQTELIDEDDRLLLVTQLPQSLKFKGKYLQARPLSEEDFNELDIVVNTSDDFTQQILLHLSPDTYVIDLTSHLTQSDYTTLVDLSILDTLKIDQIKTILPLSHIITSALTSAIQPILKATHKASQVIEHIVVSTYQAISDKGQQAMQALDKERKHDELHLNEAPQFFEQYIYSNVIPNIGAFLPSLDTTEEMQIITETKQMLALPRHTDLSITCMLVPIKLGHIISVTILIQQEISEKQFEDIKKTLKSSEHILLIEKESSITPKDTIGYNQLILSRLRKSNRTISFVITYDNLTFRAHSALELVRKLMGES